MVMVMMMMMMMMMIIFPFLFSLDFPIKTLQVLSGTVRYRQVPEGTVPLGTFRYLKVPEQYYNTRYYGIATPF